MLEHKVDTYRYHAPAHRGEKKINFHSPLSTPLTPEFQIVQPSQSSPLISPQSPSYCAKLPTRVFSERNFAPSHASVPSVPPTKQNMEYGIP